MLNLDSYRLVPSTLEPSTSKPKPKASRSKRKGGFLKGPIPTAWLSVASGLPGKSLHVGLAIWFAHGFEKQTRFKFSSKWHSWLGVGPYALRQSLQRLKEAGLIRVEYRPGCSPIVTLLTAPEEIK